MFILQDTFSTPPILWVHFIYRGRKLGQVGEPKAGSSNGKASILSAYGNAEKGIVRLRRSLAAV